MTEYYFKSPFVSIEEVTVLQCSLESNVMILHQTQDDTIQYFIGQL